MPPKYFPGDHKIPAFRPSKNELAHISRQSEPLPYPPALSPNRMGQFPSGSRINENPGQGRFSSANLHISSNSERQENMATEAHQFDYALLQQSSFKSGYPGAYQSSENSSCMNDGHMFSDGRIPSYQEAERLFNPNDTTNHFNESRLSFGIMPPMQGHHSKDPMYETLSRYNGQDIGRWSSASLNSNNGRNSRINSGFTENHGVSRTIVERNVGSVEHFESARKAPPLPPKPRLGPIRSTNSEIAAAQYRYSSGPSETRPSGIYLSGDEVDIDERGYSVSFV